MCLGTNSKGIVRTMFVLYALLILVGIVVFVTVGLTLLDPDFWEKTLQNWQSEFLAVGTLVVFTIYLRQRGSAESKPVGAPHDETASSG